jgi:hypothetical protein
VDLAHARAVTERKLLRARLKHTCDSRPGEGAALAGDPDSERQESRALVTIVGPENYPGLDREGHLGHPSDEPLLKPGAQELAGTSVGICEPGERPAEVELDFD